MTRVFEEMPRNTSATTILEDFTRNGIADFFRRQSDTNTFHGLNKYPVRLVEERDY